MTSHSLSCDHVESFHGALIQHGPLSNRIYLIKINDTDPMLLIPELDILAKQNGYTKIFAKVPADKAETFLATGYEQEASIPGFFNGDESAALLGRYFDHTRREENVSDKYERVLSLARDAAQSPHQNTGLHAHTVIRPCSEADAPLMCELYRTVFASYPFPIYDPAYICKTMHENIAYFGIETDDRLVALSSAEMDPKLANVEMTDFATLPDYRGNSFAAHLLARMEEYIRQRGIQTAYTIARAISPGINITFAKCGYQFGGRLKNNTNIDGSIESMNVWHKTLIL